METELEAEIKKNLLYTIIFTFGIIIAFGFFQIAKDFSFIPVAMVVIFFILTFRKQLARLASQKKEVTKDAARNDAL